AILDSPSDLRKFEGRAVLAGRTVVRSRAPRDRDRSSLERLNAMLQVPVQDLRRVAASLERLRGRAIGDCVMRSDLKQLNVELDDGRIMVIGIELEETGRQHRLTVDVVSPIEEVTRQLDVGLESQPE